MSNSCPINFEKVDENVSRISALFVSSLVVAYLFTTNAYVLVFLSLDFIVKLFLQKGLSPINALGVFVKKIFDIKNKLVDGGAKRLAGFFGLFFVLLLSLTHVFNSWNASLIVAVVFLSCSLFDAFFNFCVGCQIYHMIRKIYPNFMQETL